jgi:hypothetical protein
MITMNTEIAACMFVGLYLLIAFFMLAENLTGRHILGARRGGWRVVVRTAWEAAAWPVTVLPWRELPSFFRQEWRRLPVRYSGVAS